MHHSDRCKEVAQLIAALQLQALAGRARITRLCDMQGATSADSAEYMWESLGKSSMILQPTSHSHSIRARLHAASMIQGTLPADSPFSHRPPAPAPQDVLPPSNPHSEIVHKQTDVAAAAMKDMPPATQRLPQDALHQHEVALWEEMPQTAHKRMRARIPAAPVTAANERGLQLVSQLHPDTTHNRDVVNNATSAELLALSLQPNSHASRSSRKP